MASQQQTVIFLHIPKAAGSTLSNIIRRQYPEDAIWHSYPTNMPADVRHELDAAASARYRYDQVKQALRSSRGQVQILLGHEGFGYHTLFNPPATYITLLRDPIERIISHYYYALSSPQHRHHALISTEGMTLATYVRDNLSPEVDNCQTKFLAGLETPFLLRGEYDDSILARAKANIERHFSVVGLTEQFDETLILMKQALGWQTPFYVRRNVTQHRPRQKELSPETLAIIRERNKLDLALYQFARSRFDAQIEAQGPAFARELVRLQRWNQLYGRFSQMRRVVRRSFNRASQRFQAARQG